MSKANSKVSVKQAAITMLLLGFSLGYVVTSILVPASEDSTPTSHTHIPFDVSEYESLPSIEIALTKDDKKGFNLFLDTENFVFTPENASSNHVDGQGHAHLYIDGAKVTRIYSSYFYLGDLEEGRHTIKVGLSTNDHKDYFNLDEEIADEVTISEEGIILPSEE